MQNGSWRQQNAYLSILSKIFYCYFVLQIDLNLWYVYLKIQILGIIKIQSQESHGIARKDMQVKKTGVLLLRRHTLHWQISSSLLLMSLSKGDLPYLLHCQLLGHSLQPVPQLHQLLDVVWSLMHFGADGFIRLTDLQQKSSKSHLLQIDKLGNLPWSSLFPFWRWSKWWVHSPVLIFSFLIHLIWAQMERDCQKKRKRNCRYVREMMIITDLDNQLAEAIAYIPVILRRSRMTFQLSTTHIFSIHQHTFVRRQGLEEFHLKSYSFQASNLLNIFNTSFDWVCICPYNFNLK